MAVSFAQARAEHARRKQDQQTESEVGTLEASVSAVVRDPSINDVSLYERLCSKVGLGDQPQKRKLFYQRVCSLHRAQPDAVELLIQTVWSDSCGARNRGRFFCFVLKKRLAEEGICREAAKEGGGDVI